VTSGRASVDLWWVALDTRDEDVDLAATELDERERARARAFRRERDRSRFVARRVALHRILARYAGTLPEDVVIRSGENGKPYVDRPSGLRFNLSSSGAHAVVAVTEHRAVGVDVEEIRGGLDDIVDSFLSVREREELAGLPASVRLHACYRFWTLKEAYLKALGVGLGAELDAFSVSTRAAGRTALVEALPDDDPARWVVIPVSAPENCAAALAVEAEDVAVARRELALGDQ
jgi:4'-phosphopantetheinyl transferase